MPLKDTMTTILIHERDCKAQVKKYYALDDANSTYNDSIHNSECIDFITQLVRVSLYHKIENSGD